MITRLLLSIVVLFQFDITSENGFHLDNFPNICPRVRYSCMATCTLRFRRRCRLSSPIWWRCFPPGFTTRRLLPNTNCVSMPVTWPTSSGSFNVITTTKRWKVWFADSLVLPPLNEQILEISLSSCTCSVVIVTIYWMYFWHPCPLPCMQAKLTCGWILSATS